MTGPKTSTADRMARAWRAFAGFMRRWDKDALGRAESEARRAGRRLQEAVEALPEGIVFLDREGRYILWNQRYAEIYQRSADLFAVGAKLEDTLRVGIARGDYPDALGREEEWLADRLSLMATPGKRHEQRLADGRWIMIEERRTTDGGTIGIRVDITELKQQAEALRLALTRAEAANKAKTDFLANIGHEIRTPLNGVVGLASVLAATPLSPRQQEIVRTMAASAATLDELFSDMLDFARLEEGAVALARAPFRLSEAVEQAAAPLAPEIARKGLTLRLDFQAGAADEVLGDAERFKQVVVNLVSNAVKFTDAGAISISLQVRGRHQVLQVTDSGIGLSPDEIARLFNRFEQADSSTTRQFGGAGLGLAICRQLVELMGGVIHADGAPGQGATFTVELALPVVEARAAS